MSPRETTRRPLINSDGKQAQSSRKENAKQNSWLPGLFASSGASSEKPAVELTRSASSEESAAKERAIRGDAVSFMSDDSEFAEIMATDTQDKRAKIVAKTSETRDGPKRQVEPTLSDTVSVEENAKEEEDSQIRAVSPVSDIMSERTTDGDAAEIEPNASMTSDNGSEVAVMLERGRSYQKNKLIEQRIEEKAAQEGKPKKYEYKPKDYYDQKIYDELKRTGTFKTSRSTSPRGIERSVSFKGVGEDVDSVGDLSKPPVILPPNKRNQKNKAILKKPPQAKPPSNEAPELVYVKKWVEGAKNYLKLMVNVNCVTPDFKEDPELMEVPKAV